MNAWLEHKKLWENCIQIIVTELFRPIYTANLFTSWRR